MAKRNHEGSKAAQPSVQAKPVDPAVLQKNMQELTAFLGRGTLRALHEAAQTADSWREASQDLDTYLKKRGIELPTDIQIVLLNASRGGEIARNPTASHTAAAHIVTPTLGTVIHTAPPPITCPTGYLPVSDTTYKLELQCTHLADITKCEIIDPGGQHQGCVTIKVCLEYEFVEVAVVKWYCVHRSQIPKIPLP